MDVATQNKASETSQVTPHYLILKTDIWRLTFFSLSVEGRARAKEGALNPLDPHGKEKELPQRILDIRVMNEQISPQGAIRESVIRALVE